MTTSIRSAALVDTQWVADHLDDPGVRLIEANLGADTYASGHIPGAAGWSIWEDVLLPDERVNVDKSALEELLSRSGVARDSSIILYGDMHNWGAALVFWLLRAFGHRDVRLMDGGRTKWLAEGRQLVTDTPNIARTQYVADDPDWSGRASRDDARSAIGSADTVILDVRLPEEYNGELFRPSARPEGNQRAGHIPGAIHVPWETAINSDGTFRSADELRAMYREHGVTPEREIIPYCTVGGRSGHTWFVLTQLLDFPRARLYDASWAEWGRDPDAPIE